MGLPPRRSRRAARRRARPRRARPPRHERLLGLRRHGDGRRRRVLPARPAHVLGPAPRRRRGRPLLERRRLPDARDPPRLRLRRRGEPHGSLVRERVEGRRRARRRRRDEPLGHGPPRRPRRPLREGGGVRPRRRGDQRDRPEPGHRPRVRAGREPRGRRRGAGRARPGGAGRRRDGPLRDVPRARPARRLVEGRPPARLDAAGTEGSSTPRRASYASWKAAARGGSA